MSNSALRKTGSTSQWRRIRASIIARDHVCQLCGADENLHVDHIVPRALGGTDEPDNLRVLCKRCNLARNGVKRPMGGFFDTASTPPTPLVLLSPRNGLNRTGSNSIPTDSVSYD